MPRQIGKLRLLRAGIRGSRRWICENFLTADDIHSGRRFDDEIALATWLMEMRETVERPKLRFLKNNLPTGIPLRCLKPSSGCGQVHGEWFPLEAFIAAPRSMSGRCETLRKLSGRSSEAIRATTMLKEMARNGRAQDRFDAAMPV